MGEGDILKWPLYLSRHFAPGPLPKIATVIVPLSLNLHHHPSALSFSLTAEFLKFLIMKNKFVGRIGM